MSGTRDTMELREETIRAHYDPALSLLSGFDHAPRLARAVEAAAPERSAGIGTRPRFRSTTPGLATRTTTRPGSVRIVERVESLGDGLVSPMQASVMSALRRGVAIAMAMGETFGAQSGLGELKKANLEGRLPDLRRVEFSELLAAEALLSLHVFANATAFLLAPHLGTTTVEIGSVDEVLTDNAPLALQGALWELDHDIAAFASDETRLAATVAAFCEALMDRVGQRAQTAARLGAFTGGSWRVEADGLTIAGFKPARAAKGGQLTMQFKKPTDVVGNHIAKYQSLRLAKMLMAYDFERKLNPFAELGGFIFTFMGDGKPGTGKTTLIQMMAGLLDGYCKVAGYPFRYQNFSIDQIDSYQGKSGQNAKAFIDNIIDPSVIAFGTIDDIDQVAGKRRLADPRRRRDLQPDLPMPGVVTQRDGLTVRRAHPALRAEDEELPASGFRGLPPHSGVLAQAEEVAARAVAQPQHGQDKRLHGAQQHACHDQDHQHRDRKQRPGGCAHLGLVADIVAIARDQPDADLIGAFAGENAAAHLVAHVARHRRIAVGDRLALAFEAAQRLHQLGGLRLQRRIVELVIGVGRRRHGILRAQRQRHERSEKHEHRANHCAFSSSASSTGTSSARISPIC